MFGTVGTASFDQKYAKIFSQIKRGVEFRVVFNIWCHWSVSWLNKAGLVELRVVELSDADCTCGSVFEHKAHTNTALQKHYSQDEIPYFL